MSLAVCKFYLKNQKCRFGERCRFKHCIDPKPPPLDSNTREENHGKAVTSQTSTVATNLSLSKSALSENQNNEEFIDRFEQSSLDPAAASFNPRSFPKENNNVSSVRHHQGSKSQTDQPQRKICQYFVQHGTCAFGRSCWFSHTVHDDFTESDQSNRTRNKISFQPEKPPRFQRQNWRINTPPSTSASRSVKVTNGKYDTHQSKADISQSEPKGRISPKPCRLFKSGSCERGQDCRFSHSLNSAERPCYKDASRSSGNRQIREQKGDVLSADAKESTFVAGEQKDCQNETKKGNFYRPPALRQVLKLSELEDGSIEEYRQYDINYLQKRFPKRSGSSVLEDNGRSSFILQATFSPSDPDWPFDVTALELEFTLKESYPVEPMILKVLGGDDLPETVRRYLEVSISEWLMERSAGFAERKEAELVARPLLRWLDRKIEDMMTEALKQLKRELIAKASGLEFIPAEKLQARYINESVNNETGEDESNSEGDEYEEDTGDSEEDSYSSEGTESEEEKGPSLNLDPEKRGTEIELRNLQLKEKASSLIFDRLKLTLQCSRCKNHEDFNLMPGKVLSMCCGKCNQEMLATYRASLAHQFSSVIGYLDLNNCTAFDLIFQDCKAAVTCLNCSRQTIINGFVSGQLIDGWCQACNARFKIATDAVKFSHLAPSGVDVSRNTKVEVLSQKAKKPPKDPSIKEGCPLPDFGTCKHYKHSYRWLRFPCCGKAYPCDVCHDRKEDHEMVFANRMICGHCCKEQPFAATRPCNACGANLTKVHTSHWEGGSGCRDKITMSKSDTQKYKNMNKTISAHKKKVQAGASKMKNTKLRHA